MTRKFTATAHRSGDWWAIEVTNGLPADALGVTQARRLSDVDEAARDVIADILEVEAADVDVDVEVIIPDELSEFVALFRHADSFEAAARSEAATARSWAAAGLLRSRLTMREAGQLLGISHQRINQLADRATDDEPAAMIEDLRRITATDPRASV